MLFFALLSPFLVYNLGKRKEQKMVSADGKDVYQNFIDLFSHDSETMLQALKDKKDWVLNKFYIPYHITEKNEDGEMDDDLECLFHSSLPFHKLHASKIENKYNLNLIEDFNERYRLARLFKTMPCKKDDDVIYAEADLKELAKDDYKKLVASFFWCLSEEDIKEKFPEGDIRNALQLAMTGSENEAVIIMEKKNLQAHGLEIEGFKKIYTYTDMSDKVEMLLNKIADELNIRSSMIHV
jgi:hypothetical protein